MESIKKQPNISREILVSIWTHINEDIQKKYIYDLMGTTNNSETIIDIWSKYKKANQDFKEAINRYKGTETIGYIIEGTKIEIINKNILEIINTYKDDDASLVYIWSGLNKKTKNLEETADTDENNRFLKDTERMFFNKIVEKVKDNPELMIKIWTTDPEKLEQKIPGAFQKLYDLAKDDTKLLTKLWVGTRKDLQHNYVEEYKDIINLVGNNKEFLELIWEETDKNVQKEFEGVLTKIIELEAENIEKINQIWVSSSSEARVKSFKNICKVLGTHQNIGEENLDEIYKFYLMVYNENNDIVELLPTEFLQIFSKQNVESIGKEKIIQIACYSNEVKKMNGLSEKQIQLIGLCINRFMQKYETTEWIYMFKDILDNIEEYDELIKSKDSFTDEELDKMNFVFEDKNIFKIQNVQDLMNIEKIRKEKCEELIKSRYTDDRIEAICISKFGYSSQKLKNMLSLYGEDSEQISDENLKYFMNSLDMLFNNYWDYESDTLTKIFHEVQPVENINLRAIERHFKNEYAKLYDRVLFKMEDAVPNNELGDNVYELPKDENGRIKEFNSIMTAIGAFQFRDIDNYYDDWNQKSRASQHFCASFINKYMMGHAHIMSICFGFSHLGDDSLVLLGTEDIGSSKAEINSSAQGREKYLAPENLLYKTNRYNEMDIYRMQNGVRKQPDFLLCFRKEGKITNLDESKKASKQFEEKCGKALPILVVDEDEIIRNCISEFIELLEEYRDNSSKEIRDEIIRMNECCQNIRPNIFLEVFQNPEYREMYNKMCWEKDREDGLKSGLDFLQRKLVDNYSNIANIANMTGDKKSKDFLDIFKDFYEQFEQEDR